MDKFLLLVVALLCAACRDPTEIEITLRTDYACTNPAAWKGVDVYVGEPGEPLENAAPTFHTDRCDASGMIGSVVVVPSGADDARIGVRVVASTMVPPEKCRERGYAGCIVARRSLRFRPHQTVPLDIALTDECVRVPCDAQSTCEAGTCVAIGRGDSVEPEPPPEPPADKRVRCGNTFCATAGNVCCLTVDPEAGDGGIADGECKPSSECPKSSVVLFCDDTSDCAPQTDPVDGTPALCMLESTGQIWSLPDKISKSSCLTISDYKTHNAGLGLALCDDRLDCVRKDKLLPCVDSQAGTQGNRLPGYSWCLYNAADGD